jgi:hypothetical protein
MISLTTARSMIPAAASGAAAARSGVVTSAASASQRTKSERFMEHRHLFAGDREKVIGGARGRLDDRKNDGADGSPPEAGRYSRIAAMTRL